MFGEFSLRLIGIYVNILKSLISIPYSWDWKRKTIVDTLAHSKIKTIGFYFSFFHSIVYLFYLFLQLIQLGRETRLDYVAAVWTINWMTMYLWAVITFMNGHRKRHDNISIFQGTQMLTDQLYKENCLETFKPIFWKLTIVDIHFLAVVWIDASYFFILLLMFIATPTSPHYIYSLVSKEPNRLSGTFIAFLIFELYSKISNAFMMSTDALTPFTTWLSNTFWLIFFTKEFKAGRRSCRMVFREFRKQEILLRYFNYSTIWLLLPFLTVWVPAGLAINNGFGAIRFNSFLSFAEYIPFPIIFINGIILLTLILVPTAGVYEASRNLHKELQSSYRIQRDKFLNKELKAMKPFGVKVGFILQVKKIAIFLSYIIISDRLFTILVSVPQEKVSPI